MGFKKAIKSEASIKLALSGPSGAGKTYSALRIAKGLEGETAFLDTENKSASLYADKFEFDVWEEMDPRGYPPEFFINVIHEAEKAGYRNLVIDSLTHEWNGRGGCLELADQLTRTKYRGNSFHAWGEVTPRHNALIEAILSSKMNIIATMRAKTEYVLNKDERTGKTAPQKVGLQSVQRDGIDYEFTIMFDLDRDSHLANASKDRTSLFEMPELITEATGEKIAAWLTKDEQGNQTPTETETAPKTPQKRPKQSPVEYILKVLETKTSEGEERTKVLKDFANILCTDAVREPEQMNEAEQRELATVLYKTQKKEN